MLSPNLTCFQQEGYKLIYINGIKLGKFIHPVGIIEYILYLVNT